MLARVSEQCKENKLILFYKCFCFFGGKQFFGAKKIFGDKKGETFSEQKDFGKKIYKIKLVCFLYFALKHMQACLRGFVAFFNIVGPIV